MTYKTKISVLAGIIAALALTYILSLVFDPERINSRSWAYSWLDAKQTDAVERIEIRNPENRFTLVRKGEDWSVLYDNKEYPGRNLRVEDFIKTLAKRASYPVFSSNSSSHERLSLTGESSNRVTITGGNGQTLLDLYLGVNDASGRNIFMRKQDRNEVRSGEDIFSGYVNSDPGSWYNLRLFPESENGGLDVTSVQRLTVYPPAEEGVISPARIFARSGREWTFNFEVKDPDMGKVDTYIRYVLNASGSHFADDMKPSDSGLNDCRILLELDDGSIKSARFGPENYDEETGDDRRRYAAVSGSPLVYSIPGWAVSRLFPETSTFEREEE